MDFKINVLKSDFLVSGGKTGFCGNFQIKIYFLHAKFGLATTVFFNRSVRSAAEDRHCCNSLLFHCLSKCKFATKML